MVAIKSQFFLHWMCVDCLPCTYTHKMPVNPSENAFISIVRRLSAHASFCAVPTNRQQKYARSEKYNSALSRVTFFHSLKRPAAATCDRSAHRSLRTRCISWSYFNFFSLFAFVFAIDLQGWMNARRLNISWRESYYDDATSICHDDDERQKVNGRRQDADWNRFIASHAIYVFVAIFTFIQKCSSVWYNSRFNRRNDKHTFFHETRLFVLFHSFVDFFFCAAVLHVVSICFASIGSRPITLIQSPCR